MSEIKRPGALYQQVAAAIRDAILAGEFPPGAALPSESQLIERYKVSRPTVRNAISALRSEGLIDVQHGKGSFVRALPTPTMTIDRSVHGDGQELTTGDEASWLPAEQPTVYRTTASATTGPLLGLAGGEALFGSDWLLVDPKSSARWMHRVLIPFTTAEGTPLADEPGRRPAAIYSILTTAGHHLRWTETVTARMPLPDERAALEIPDATPLLHTTRVTHGADDQPLLLEELRVSADRAQIAYHITAEAPARARA
ncbi:GntR family transcriptional regulator [Streptomyces sp. URMC 123]|uniref:GntR family transcriptional regulator n=1 Tax=Streptomyces sp. URMC 123 TaxID=3423403 RepID=UPI003F1A91F6